jgi:hypothetical protein
MIEKIENWNKEEVATPTPKEETKTEDETVE